MTKSSVCPCCGHSGLDSFYSVRQVPVHSVTLLRTPQEADAIGTGDIELALCRNCGFIHNAAFEGTKLDYFHDYVSTQAKSDVFSAFHRRLAEDLIRRHDLHGRQVVEIGCGQGEFLQLLAKLGDNQGIGFDPAYEPTTQLPPNVRIIKDLYSDRHPEAASDFVCCKMTLEHIDSVGTFVAGVRQAMGDDPARTVFFQVPDASRVLAEGAFWDVYYEHCSYFAGGTLKNLFQRAGFEVTSISRDYGNQYLMVEGHPAAVGAAAPPVEDVGDVIAAVERFRTEVPRQIEAWREHLRCCAASGRRTVLWGGGSKAVAFLTTLRIGSEIDAVVDINEEKHGTYLARTGHLVVSPQQVAARRPDTVIVMNPMYCREVSMLLHSLDCHPEIVPVTTALGAMVPA